MLVKTAGESLIPETREEKKTADHKPPSGDTINPQEGSKIIDKLKELFDIEEYKIN